MEVKRSRSGVRAPPGTTHKEDLVSEVSVARRVDEGAPKRDQAWPPWKERVLRGYALWGSPLGAEIEPQGHGKYTVPSCSGQGVTYEVDLDISGDEESCSCPDRERPCKHLVAATIYRSKARAKARREQHQRFETLEARRGARG
jgi:hypothetical protein